ncbi:P-loop containing nucleoside triphosphate hydrolase [Pseudocohnilembus persalinus]|uniref:p-loop containing nucleoside triphosphate hydrolase n=1 Tax=Pseudocohnilembus persalinus TaxID=266149 RepID=A0A0V0Q7B9_PSEPJ|nr:P-loop containing nucleoside triphosphate hydrolase [Pseudocohnilembus persalinus]|eukprot:KRW98124.1 P-loop containing nucleoside triphosphate hydrolase [Pseudocohnilembus persalinus]
MGSSGAGKTSLLNIFCKRIKTRKNIFLEGKMWANNMQYSYDEFSDFGSYVMQDDRLYDSLTVKETLIFAAKMKIKNQAQQKERVKYIIRYLKLEQCEHTLVGGKVMKGISGGEKKRTSIAIELVNDPQVMILDEPTSGLDSFTAFLVINQLRSLAKEHNRTIIFTIHQPNSDIWQLFDRFMLMVQGRFVYQGQGGQNVIKHFCKMGIICKQNHNPADFFISICHKADKKNVENYEKYFEFYEKCLQLSVEQEIEQQNLLISTLYFQLPNGEDDPNNVQDVQNYAGFMFFQTVNQIMLAIQAVALTFPLERGIFLKEENSRMYSIGAYFIGRSLIEIPYLIIFPTIQSIIQYFMVGIGPGVDIFFKYIFANICVSFTGNSIGILVSSLFTNTRIVFAILPMFFLPLIAFSGLYGNREDLWKGLSWIEYISPFKYGFDAQMGTGYHVFYY